MAKTTQEKIEYMIKDVKSNLFTDLYLMKEKSEELLKIANQPNDHYGQAYAFLFLSYYYIFSDYEELCIYTMKKAKDLSNSPDLIADYHFIRGLYYYSVCNNYDALKEFFECMEYYRTSNQYVSLVYAHVYSARIVSDLQEYKMEHSMLEAAVEAALQCEEPYRSKLLVLCYVEIANNACQRDRDEDVDNAIREAEALQGKDNALSLSAIKIHYLVKQNQYKEAGIQGKQFIQKFLMSNEDKSFQFTSIERVTRDMIASDNYDVARTCIKVIEGIFEKIHLKNKVAITTMKIAFIEKFNVDQYLDVYEEYYEQVIKGIQVDDKIQSENIKNEILLSELNETHENILRENEKLRLRVNIDELTQIYNRTFHNKLLTKLINDERIQSIGYIMFDVDYFKHYNDNYGHLYGDKVLREIGDTLNKFSTENIISCRYGGDEFNCFCINQTKEEIETFIQNVIQDINAKNMKHAYSPISNRVTLSIGYDLQVLNDKQVLDQIILNADKALYEVKNQGRNGWKQYIE